LVDEIKFQRRQIAYKVRLKDILDSKYTKREGFDPNFLEIGGKEVSRINMVGVIVQKSEINNYRSLTIDDGTGKISARIFENDLMLDKVDVGDVVLIIGRPREFSSEKYILIEIIKKIEPKWTKVRKLELEKKIIASNYPIKENCVEGEIIDENPKNKILKFIKKFDEGQGVSVENIPTNDIEDIDKIVDALLKEGDVFEIKPGKLKVLE